MRKKDIKMTKKGDKSVLNTSKTYYKLTLGNW